MKYKVPKTERHFDQVFYFTVALKDDDAYEAIQVDDRPVGVSQDQDSLLILDLTPDGENGLLIQITWLTPKPDPNTLARHNGVLAVMRDIHGKVDEKTRVALAAKAYGIGHLYGAKVTETPKND